MLEFAPVSWLASKDSRPNDAIGLPGIPSGRLQFPRLQLRGSAGFAPASLLVKRDEDARTKNVKEQTTAGEI